MALVKVSTLAFAAGQLPVCCARHGEPATTAREVVIYSRGQDLAGSGPRRSVRGNLPLCPRCIFHDRLVDLSVALAFVLALASIPLGGLVSPGNLAPVAVVFSLCILPALGWHLLSRTQRTHAALSDDGSWVTMGPVTAHRARRPAPGYVRF